MSKHTKPASIAPKDPIIAPKDPIEAAKAAGALNEDPSAEQEGAGAAAERVEEPQLPEPATAPVKAPVFVVENPGPTTVSWRGQSCRFQPGDTISEDSYGDGAIELFKNAGLKLREV